MGTASNQRYATGLDPLDRRLAGGIPVGTLLAFVTPTRTQSELLLYQLASERPTHFLSTTCPDAETFRDRLPRWVPEENVGFDRVDPEAVLADPESALAAVGSESYLVVDSVDALEATAERRAYLDALDAFSRWAREHDGVAVCHCLTDVDHTSEPRWRRLTEKRADHVWELHRQVTTQQIQAQLLVAKARGDAALAEPLPLLLTDRVRIDTSQRIG